MVKRNGFPNIIDIGKYLQCFTTQLESTKQQNLSNSRFLLFSYRRLSGSPWVYDALLKSYPRNPHQRNRLFLRCMNKCFLRSDFLFTIEVLGIIKCQRTFLSALRLDHDIEVLQARATRSDWDCSSLTRENYI